MIMEELCERNFKENFAHFAKVLKIIESYSSSLS